MDKFEYWKNFSLGTELEVSGGFIYNGLRTINEINNYHYAEDIFEILYNISVGIERLEKIAIVLIEHEEITNQEEFEKKLIGHNHQELLDRIKIKHQLNFGKTHNKLIKLLSVFYKKYRYDRFNINMDKEYSKDKSCLIEFIESELKIEISDSFPFGLSINSKNIKTFLGKTIGKITSELYAIIEIEARLLNIYTYDVKTNSKAYHIFINKDFTFKYDEILKKEFILNLINHSNSKFISLIKNIKPLPFDIQDENEIIKCFCRNNFYDYYDELDSLYEQISNRKERLEQLSLLGH